MFCKSKSSSGEEVPKTEDGYEEFKYLPVFTIHLE